MNGFRVKIERLFDDTTEEKSYNREKSETIYDQKVAELDIRAVISVVNSDRPIVKRSD